MIINAKTFEISLELDTLFLSQRSQSLAESTVGFFEPVILFLHTAKGNQT